VQVVFYIYISVGVINIKRGGLGFH
jgi:hypothetical protein